MEIMAEKVSFLASAKDKKNSTAEISDESIQEEEKKEKTPKKKK